MCEYAHEESNNLNDAHMQTATQLVICIHTILYTQTMPDIPLLQFG